MQEFGGNAAKQLRSFIDRIERFEEERRELAEDVKELFKEAKSNGFEPKIMRRVIRNRRRGVDAVEEEALIEVYKRALGMLADTPLGEAALARTAE